MKITKVNSNELDNFEKIIYKSKNFIFLSNCTATQTYALIANNANHGH